jgi:hypothetical protein
MLCLRTAPAVARANLERRRRGRVAMAQSIVPILKVSQAGVWLLVVWSWFQR